MGYWSCYGPSALHAARVCGRRPACTASIGMTGVGPVTVLPLATGMAITLTLLALRGERRAELAEEDAAAAAAASDEASASAAPAAAVGITSPAAAGSGQQAAGGKQEETEAAAAAAAAQQQRLPDPDVVVWSRVDQKTCLKAVTAAGLTPHVVQLRRQGDQLVTDLEVRGERGRGLRRV